MNILLFILGAIFGSFVNVVALRYDPDRSLFDLRQIGGRSHCPHCARTLRAIELIPLISFCIQRGRCCGCGKGISFRYPLVEALNGVIFVSVPYLLHTEAISLFPHLAFSSLIIVSGAWVLAFEALLLIALIDIRFRIIPDEMNVLLVVLGVFLAVMTAGDFGLTSGSFSGPYAALFGVRGNAWANHLAGFLFGGAFFGFLVLLTRGRGMGMGDVKLAASLGALFGWPDVLFLTVFAFVSGSVVGLLEMAFRGKGLKSLLPFGPFLALGAALVFFFGHDIVGAYFSLFPMP